jgi:hypothetical protein
MNDARWAAYEKFRQSRRNDFRRIAYKAQGCEPSDVEAEAWIMAIDVFEAQGAQVDFENVDFQDRLIAYLYQAFTRYADPKIRYSQRFEASEENAGDERGSRPLLERLAASTLDPLAQLIQHEDNSEVKERRFNYRHSQAAAWCHLIELYGNNVPALARHLMISQSWCYRRYANALQWMQRQHPLPDTLSIRMGEQPGPWRRFKAIRVPVQLSFDFELVLPLQL